MSWIVRPPPGATASWCCRATFQPKAYLEIQWYRQTHCGKEEEVKQLAAWARDNIEKIRDRVFELSLRVDEDREVIFQIEEHSVLVNPERSWGYVYIAIWRTP